MDARAHRFTGRLAQINASPVSHAKLCECYLRWLRHCGLSMREVHRAGEKIFVDYAEQKPSLVDPATGERTTAELFVAHEAFFSLAALNGRIAELLAGVGDLCGPRSPVAIRPCDSS